MKFCNSPGDSSLGGKIAASIKMELLLFLSSGREVPARFPCRTSLPLSREVLLGCCSPSLVTGGGVELFEGCVLGGQE